MTKTCGVRDYALVRDRAVPDEEVDEATGHGLRHPTCTLPLGHDGRWHAEVGPDGEVLAEWSGGTPREVGFLSLPPVGYQSFGDPWPLPGGRAW